MAEEIKTSTHWCTVCEEVFTIPSRRGRPPSKCSKCLAEIAAKEESTVVQPTPVIPQQRTEEPNDSGKQMNLFCHACNEVFTFPARRGRPPKYCTNCIGSGKAETHEEARLKSDKEKARLRCDNLEMLLKSRGTHISQQKNWR